MNELMRRRRAMMTQGGGNGKSDMNGWTDGVPYTDLEVVKNSYYNNGVPANYNNWDRTGYVPCSGAGSITFPPMPVGGATSYLYWNYFFDASKNKISAITMSNDQSITVNVPANAAFWGASCYYAYLLNFLGGNIIPHKGGM